MVKAFAAKSFTYMKSEYNALVVALHFDIFFGLSCRLNASYLWSNAFFVLRIFMLTIWYINSIKDRHESLYVGLSWIIAVPPPAARLAPQLTSAVFPLLFTCLSSYSTSTDFLSVLSPAAANSDKEMGHKFLQCCLWVDNCWKRHRREVCAPVWLDKRMKSRRKAVWGGWWVGDPAWRGNGEESMQHLWCHTDDSQWPGTKQFVLIFSLYFLCFKQLYYVPFPPGILLLQISCSAVSTLLSKIIYLFY